MKFKNGWTTIARVGSRSLAEWDQERRPLSVCKTQREGLQELRAKFTIKMNEFTFQDEDLETVLKCIK